MTNIYKTERGTVADNKLPKVSTGLDSVKTFAWEIHFNIPNAPDGAKTEQLVLAARSVKGIGYEVEPIEVQRVNDKLYYPGRAKMDILEVVFDNQYLSKNGAALYQYMKRIYNPITGEILTAPGVAGGFKIPSVKVIQLKNDMTPFSESTLYGVFPISFKPAELNYDTQAAFHTITMTFRYDYMSHVNEGGIP